MTCLLFLTKAEGPKSGSAADEKKPEISEEKILGTAAMQNPGACCRYLSNHKYIIEQIHKFMEILTVETCGGKNEVREGC